MGKLGRREGAQRKCYTQQKTPSNCDGKTKRRTWMTADNDRGSDQNIETDKQGN